MVDGDKLIPIKNEDNCEMSSNGVEHTSQRL